MAEMRNLHCPACATVNQPFALSEGVEEFRCRACGLVYCGPCGCDIVHEEPVSASRERTSRKMSPSSFQGLSADWAMATPAAAIANASAVSKFPGCS